MAKNLQSRQKALGYYGGTRLLFSPWHQDTPLQKAALYLQLFLFCPDLSFTEGAVKRGNPNWEVHRVPLCGSAETTSICPGLSVSAFIQLSLSLIPIVNMVALLCQGQFTAALNNFKCAHDFMGEFLKTCPFGCMQLLLIKQISNAQVIFL